MSAAFLLLLLTSSAFAQGQAGPAQPVSSCGPSNMDFDVKLDSAQHSLGQPEPGKALVYVIEVFERPPGELGTPTIRVGLNGTWVGANRGSSYLSFSVDPGEHHLCTNWQSRFKRLSGQHSLANFTAEAGKTYFFRVQTHVESEGRNSEVWYIELQPVNPDEGKYLIDSSPLSVSHPKK
jgi:hypothetical protein